VSCPGGRRRRFFKVFKKKISVFLNDEKRILSRAGFKGAQGARASGLPPTEGLPPNPSYFICRSC